MGTSVPTILFTLTEALRDCTPNNDGLVATVVSFGNGCKIRLEDTFVGATINVSRVACIAPRLLILPPGATARSCLSGAALNWTFAVSSPVKMHRRRGEKVTLSCCGAIQHLLQQKLQSRGTSGTAIIPNSSASYRSKGDDEGRKERYGTHSTIDRRAYHNRPCPRWRAQDPFVLVLKFALHFDFLGETFSITIAGDDYGHLRAD